MVHLSLGMLEELCETILGAGEVDRDNFLKFASCQLMIRPPKGHFCPFQVSLTENGLMDSILSPRRRAIARWMLCENAEIIGGVRSPKKFHRILKFCQKSVRKRA